MPEAPRRPTLSVLTGPKAGTKFVVEDAVDNILIGSDPSCRFCLDSPGVSPIHARVWIDLGGATVYDTNSPRGIYVNDDRVVREAPLRSGDVLWLGPPGEDESVLIQYVAPAAAVEAVPEPQDEPATMIQKPPVARTAASADEQAAIKTEEVEIDEVEMMRIAATAAVRSAPTVEASAPLEPPPVAADPASFDPASFDPASFEPASFEPADAASTEDPSKFEVDLPDNTTVRADFEEDIEMTISDVPSDALLGDEPPAETVSLSASEAFSEAPAPAHQEEPATVFQIAYEPLPTPQFEEPATVFQVPSAPPPSEPPAPVAPAAQSFEDEAVEEAATIVQARPSFDPDAPAVFAATAPPFRPAAPAPAPATPPPVATTRPPSRPSYLPPTAPTPTPRPPRPQPPPTVERARPAEGPRPMAREEAETRTRARSGGSSKAPMIIAAGVVLLALALGAGWFLMRGRGGEVAPVAEVPSAAPTDVAAGAPPTAEPAPPAGTAAATAAPPDTAPPAAMASPPAVATLPPTLAPVKETVTVVRPSPQVAAGQRPPTSAPPAGTAAKGPAAATPPPVVAPVEPPPAARAANLVQQAQQAAGSKNYDAAVTLYDEALKLDPANAAAQSGRTAAVAARTVARRAFVPGRTVVRAGKAGGGIAGFDSSDVSVQKAPDFQGRIELEMSPGAYNAGEPYRLQVVLVNEGKKPIKVSGLTVTTSVNGTKSATPLTPRVKEIAPQQRAVLEELPGVWPAGLTSWSAEVLVTAGKDESLRNTLNWR